MNYWTKIYGKGEARGAILAKNGDIIVVGERNKEDGFVTRLNKRGNIEWFKTYGGKKGDRAYAVAIAPNGDIIVAGTTGSFGAGHNTIVLRLPPDGELEGFGMCKGKVIVKNSDAISTETHALVSRGYRGRFIKSPFRECHRPRMFKEFKMKGEVLYNTSDPRFAEL